VNYGYDTDSRISSISYQTGLANVIGTLSYVYDGAGRRTQVGGTLSRTNLPATVSSASYDAGNELTSWNGTTISYDANGNIANDGTAAYTWNGRNQLVGRAGTVFQYDPYGRRTRNSAGNNLFYDGADATQELSGGTPVANRAVGGTDEFFTRTDATGTYTPITDALGSVLGLADSSGNIVTQYTYDPFGNTTSSGAASSNTSQYTGRENDGNGLYYYRARYYSPVFGRFMSEDPIGFMGGINRYAYANEDPVNNGDPFGLCSDPGGSGNRYCAEAYIPQSSAWLGPIPFGGDNRGPQANGGTYRWHQDYGSNGAHCKPGISKLLGAVGVTAHMDNCEAVSLVGRKSNKRFRLRAAGGDGWGFGGAPDARYDLTISETDTGVLVTGFLTDYPNVEVWQYSGEGPPRLILDTHTSWSPVGGPISLLPPDPMVPVLQNTIIPPN